MLTTDSVNWPCFRLVDWETKSVDGRWRYINPAHVIYVEDTGVKSKPVTEKFQTRTGDPKAGTEVRGEYEKTTEYPIIRLELQGRELYVIGNTWGQDASDVVDALSDGRYPDTGATSMDILKEIREELSTLNGWLNTIAGSMP